MLQLVTHHHVLETLVNVFQASSDDERVRSNPVFCDEFRRPLIDLHPKRTILLVCGMVFEPILNSCHTGWASYAGIKYAYVYS